MKARGGIDVLVNNAGYNHRGPVVDADPAELARIVDVNLRGPMLLTRFALPVLLQQPRASVVNVASIAGQVPLPGEATYSGTKFGLRGFSMALAEELRGTGVRVSIVSPGPIETGFITDDLESVPDIVFSQPMSSAEDVARAILDCADDGRLERTLPRITGLLATAGYLVPEIPRLLRPHPRAAGPAGEGALSQAARVAPAGVPTPSRARVHASRWTPSSVTSSRSSRSLTASRIAATRSISGRPACRAMTPCSPAISSCSPSADHASVRPSENT